MYKVYLIRRLKVRKKKSEILNIIKEEIISNYKSYILVIILFSVGLFLGVLFINQTENHILSLENRDRNGLTNRINDLKKYAKWLKRNILILNLRKVINEHIDS